MTHKQYMHYAAWVATLGWMGIIFYFSHQPGSISSELSSGIGVWITDLRGSVPFGLTDNVLHYIIRKGAHVLAYLVLGVLLMIALNRETRHVYKHILLTLGIGIFYAISDEVHQLFIPCRSGEVTDVLIDSSGVLIGIGIYLLLKHVFHRLIK